MCLNKSAQSPGRSRQESRKGCRTLEKVSEQIRDPESKLWTMEFRNPMGCGGGRHRPEICSPKVHAGSYQTKKNGSSLVEERMLSDLESGRKKKRNQKSAGPSGIRVFEGRHGALRKTCPTWTDALDLERSRKKRARGWGARICEKRDAGMKWI